jgi:hypothetical protein
MLSKTPWPGGTRRRCPRYRTLVICVLLAGAAPALLAGPAAGQTRPTEPTVSLNVKDKPLADVLAQITRATGSDFVIDPFWQRVPVTAFVENAPLSVALTRVLSGLNHAIVYLPQNRIKILIYEASPPSAAPGLPPALAPAPGPARVPPRARQPNLPPAGPPESVDPLRNAPPDTGGAPPPVPPAEEEPAE